MQFFFFIAAVILLRLTELLVSKKNEIWLRKNGAVEYGQKHYPFIVMLHVCFILSMIAEYIFKTEAKADIYFLGLFVLLIGIKAVVINSLGKYWNTKIFRIHNTPLIRNGLYKYFKHPNYFIVVCEIAVTPLTFHLYFTAIIFSVLNAIMLSIRIKEENNILK